MRTKIIDTAFDLYNPSRKFLLLAEGDEEGQEGAGGGEGAEGEGEGTQEAVHGDQEAIKADTEGDGDGEAKGDGKAKAEEQADDWRAAITDEKMREHAKRFASLDDLVKANFAARQKLSTAIVKPGKDAPPEDVAAYRKAMEIPEEAKGYEFPDLPEGMEMTDEVEQSRAVWAERFHNLDVPAATAKELARMVNEDSLAAMAAEIERDKAHADAAEAALRKEWRGAEYDRNMEFKDRAVAEMFGDDLEDVRSLELKNGRFALDDPRLLKAFAKVGREMDEGSLGEVMTEADRDRTQSELSSLREGIAKAQSKGDSDEANRLYQKEQAILAKMNGNQPVVGAQGRAA